MGQPRSARRFCLLNTRLLTQQPSSREDCLLQTRQRRFPPRNGDAFGCTPRTPASVECTLRRAFVVICGLQISEFDKDRQWHARRHHWWASGSLHVLHSLIAARVGEFPRSWRIVLKPIAPETGTMSTCHNGSLPPLLIACLPSSPPRTRPYVFISTSSTLRTSP